MRRLMWIGIAAIALMGTSADAGSAPRRVSAGSGLSLVLPHGWRLGYERVSTCIDPLQRFVATIGNVRLRSGMSIPPRSALVLVQETFSQSRFPARPRSFVLPRLGKVGGCCEMPEGRGGELLFRDHHGRRFYVFFYLGSRAPAGARGDIVALLKSLRVEPIPGAGAGA